MCPLARLGAEKHRPTDAGRASYQRVSNRADQGGATHFRSSLSRKHRGYPNHSHACQHIRGAPHSNFYFDVLPDESATDLYL